MKYRKIKYNGFKVELTSVTRKANGKANGLSKSRTIIADDTLRPFFNGRDSVTMFALGKCVNAHVSKVETKGEG